MRNSTTFIRFLLAGTVAAALAACSGSDDQAAAAANSGTEGAAPTAAAPVATAAAATGPASWKLPMATKSLAAADYDAIMKAAKFSKFGKIWAGDAESAKEGCSAGIDDTLFDGKPSIRDLNGDGNPEVVVTDTGTFCYGNTGQGFTILSWTGSGWRQLIQSSGIPLFVARKGSAWPDIDIGGPGFCFPRIRWTGKDYSGDGGWFYDGKPCKNPMAEEDTPPPPPVAAAPAGQPKMVAGLPVPLGFYVIGDRCTGAKWTDGIEITPQTWKDVDGDYNIRPVKNLGGGKYRLGEAVEVAQVTGPRSFIAEPGKDYQRVFTWCSATAPR